jgi:hypothetical protein
VRTLSAEEQASLVSWADHYVILAAEYIRRGIINPEYPVQER